MQSFKKLIVPALAMAAFALVAGTAQADTYDLTLVGGSYSAHWQMDSSPVLQPEDSLDGQLWVVSGVQGDFNGANQSYVGFLNSALLGGIVVGTDETGNTFDAYAFGTQVYAGSEAAPTLLLGTYSLLGADFTTTYTLTISQAAPVPEPESYALMLGGLAALGLVAARRRKA
jgi:hypothetical protein